MYDELFITMLEAHTATSWFAFGETMKVTEEIGAVCQAYKETPEEAKKSLFEVADKASRFLRSQNTNETRSASKNLETCLTTIRMEG